jgi:hypothetical protein
VSCQTVFALYCVGWARLKDIRREPVKTTSLIIATRTAQQYQSTPNLLRSYPDLPSCPKYIAIFIYVEGLRASIGSRWSLFLENCGPYYFDIGLATWLEANWPFPSICFLAQLYLLDSTISNGQTLLWASVSSCWYVQ